MERRALKTRLEACIYPVLTLPNEIVSEIFIKALPEEPYRSPPDDASPSPSGPSCPLLLGQVCRRWRQIALSTPSLWTALDLSLDDKLTNHKNQLCLLQTWLERSRACPLTISIYWDGSSPVGTHEFIEVLVPHSQRWEHMDFIIPFRDLLLIKGDMPLLRELAIGFPDLGSDPAPSSPPVQAFHSAPKLKTVIIPPTFYPDIVPLPWAQITFLSVGAAFPHQLANIMHSLVNVEQLRVQIVAASPEETMANIADFPPLAHLHTLDLYGSSDPVAITQLLENLNLPALAYLNAMEECFEIPGPVQRLLARSGCPLPALRITIIEAALSSAYYRTAWPSVGKILVTPYKYAHLARETSTSEDEDEVVDSDGNDDEVDTSDEGDTSSEASV